MATVELKPTTRRVRLNKPNPTDLVVLVSGKLAGRERRIGETISASEWATVTPKMKKVLLEAGRVGPLSAMPPAGPAEAKASKQVKASQAKLKKAERLRDDLLHRQKELEKNLDDLAKQRQPLSFAAVQGEKVAQGKLETLREETVTAEIELSDLNVALKEAIKEVDAAQKGLVHADADRYLAEADRLIKTQGKTCEAIQTLVEGPLKDLLGEYVQNQRRFAHAVPSGNIQVQSGWRLDSILRRAMGLPELARGNFKFDSLKEIETRVMRDALSRFRAKQRSKQNEVKANGESSN